MTRNQEIAQIILQQLGGANRLKMMTGAYNFVAVENGVAFKIKNPKANYIKVTLNGLDLYDLEVGRIRGTTYKVVTKENNLYNDMLKPAIEKATGMYLSLYKKGGKIPDWLFIGTYPNAYVYADKRKESRGEYHKIGMITFSPLNLKIEDNSPEYKGVIAMMKKELESLKDKKEVQVTTTGQKAAINYMKKKYAKGGSVANLEIGGFRRNILGTLSFKLKLPSMRKEQDFSVYPIDEKTDYILIQSGTRFGRIQMSTGSGIMSQSHPNGAYAFHLQTDKKVQFDLTDSQLTQLKQELSKTAGNNVGSMGIVSDNSFADKFAKGGLLGGFNYSIGGL